MLWLHFVLSIGGDGYVEVFDSRVFRSVEYASPLVLNQVLSPRVVCCKVMLYVSQSLCLIHCQPSSPILLTIIDIRFIGSVLGTVASVSGLTVSLPSCSLVALVVDCEGEPTPASAQVLLPPRHISVQAVAPLSELARVNQTLAHLSNHWSLPYVVHLPGSTISSSILLRELAPWVVALIRLLISLGQSVGILESVIVSQ